MADTNPNRPTNFVFGRRRHLRALAPPDGTVSPPTIYCPAAASPNRLTVNMTASIA